MRNVTICWQVHKNKTFIVYQHERLTFGVFQTATISYQHPVLVALQCTDTADRVVKRAVEMICGICLDPGVKSKYCIQRSDFLQDNRGVKEHSGGRGHYSRKGRRGIRIVIGVALVYCRWTTHFQREVR